MMIRNDGRSAACNAAERLAYDAHIVEHALRVQKSCNTPSAVEYLKAQGVAGRTIHRILLSVVSSECDAYAPPVGH